MTDRMGAGMSKFIEAEVCSALSENSIKVLNFCYGVWKMQISQVVFCCDDDQSSGKVQVVMS